MTKRGPRTLLKAVMQGHPDLADPAAAIREGKIRVDGAVVHNPASMVGPGSNVSLVTAVPLRGEVKLRAALDRFKIEVAGRVALDAGAAAGGFTRVLLEYGASRVYAVDAGHGQLVGSLQQDPRVVNLENTNIAALTRTVVPDAVGIITLDLSYLSLTDAVPQLDRLALTSPSDLISLVKPMFELRLPHPPDDEERLEHARILAVRGLEAAGWQVLDSMESPVRGSRGAFEYLLHARRGRG